MSQEKLVDLTTGQWSQGVVLIDPVSGNPYSTVNSSSSTANKTNISASITDVLLLSSNTNRKGGVILNDSTSVLYLSCGTSTASTTSFTLKVDPYGYVELRNGEYTGEIRGIWASATGAARVTEFV